MVDHLKITAGQRKRSLRGIGLMILIVVAAGCDQPEPIVIGVLGSLSAKSASFGVGSRNGVIMAVEAQNRLGGINGARVRLIFEDDRADRSAAINAINALIKKKPAAIIGPISSSVASVVKPIADRARVPLVSPTATSTLFSDQDDYFFRVCADSRSMAGKMAEHLGGRLQRIAVVYNLDNREFTENWLDHFQKKFVRAGGRIVATESFHSREQNLYTELVRKLLTHDPQGVLIIATAPDTAMLAQQIRKIDNEILIAGADGAANERLINMGGRSVEGLVVAQPIDSTDRSARYLEFKAAYQKRFGSSPNFPAIRSYEAALLVLKALETNPTDLKAGLLNQGELEGIQGRYRLNKFGDASREPFVTRVESGEFVPVR